MQRYISIIKLSIQWISREWYRLPYRSSVRLKELATSAAFVCIRNQIFSHRYHYAEFLANISAIFLRLFTNQTTFIFVRLCFVATPLYLVLVSDRFILGRADHSPDKLFWWKCWIVPRTPFRWVAFGSVNLILRLFNLLLSYTIFCLAIWIWIVWICIRKQSSVTKTQLSFVIYLQSTLKTT